MAAGSAVPFCKFADVVKIVSPMADSLKVVIIDIAAGYLSLLAAFCKIPNLVAVLYSEQLFVFGVNEADTPLGAFQMAVKEITAVAVAIQIVIAFAGIQSENICVLVRIRSEGDFLARRALNRTFRMRMTIIGKLRPANQKRLLGGGS